MELTGPFSLWTGLALVGVIVVVLTVVLQLNGGAVFYHEDSVCYIYQNYAVLVGLIAVLLIITAVFGVTVWTNAH